MAGKGTGSARRKLAARPKQAARPTKPVPRHCVLCGTALRAIREHGVPRRACPRCGFIAYRNPVPACGVIVMRGGRVLLAKQDRSALGGHGREEQVEEELEELGQRTVHDELVRGLAQRIEDPVLPGQGLHDLGAAGDARGEVSGRELADAQPVCLGGRRRGEAGPIFGQRARE